jgi:Putative prokaryotic signal transducing protein
MLADRAPGGWAQEVWNLPKVTKNIDNDRPNWIVVARMSGITEAMMFVERLKSLGVPAVVQNEPVALALGLAIGPYAQARVLVPEGFFEQALELLEPPDSPELGAG